MRARAALVSVGLGLAAAGCEFLYPPTEIELGEGAIAVHAVLAAGSERAAVLLTRIGPEEEFVPGRAYLFDPGVEPVSGAEVRLVAGGDTVRLAEAAPGFPSCFGFPAPDSGPGCYAARVPEGIRTGVEYRLRVRLPDGTVIEGGAVPPPTPVILAPDPHAAVPVRMEPTTIPGRGLGEVPVRFRAPSGVAGIGVRIDGPVTAFRNGAPAADVDCRAGASLAVLPPDLAGTVPVPLHAFSCSRREGDAYRPVRPDSVHARLYLTAYDSAFVRYRPLLREQQVDPATATQGLTGAMGLFSAAATAVRDITLVPTD